MDGGGMMVGGAVVVGGGEVVFMLPWYVGEGPGQRC